MCSSVSGLGSVLQAKQEQLHAQIGIAVLSKGNEVMRDQGEAAIELLQAATDIARQLGKGLQFDARA